MSTEQQQHALLEEFRVYLEQRQLEQAAIPDQVDLATLLAEMAALKTEVKTESRQFKNSLDTLTDAVSTLKDANQALSAELSGHQETLARQRTEITRGLLLEMIDIYDRLNSGLEILQRYRPLHALFRHSRDEDVRFITSFKAGQIMTLERFQQYLQRHHVRALDCVGRMFDPAGMIAVETGHDPGLKHGIVLQELRKGFLFQDQVLRLAEVKVNKIQS